MAHPCLKYLAAIGLVLSTPTVALAGMPSVSLSDIGMIRLQDISFFLVVFFVSVLIIRGLWNYLSRDFNWMPRIGFRKATALVALWGLLFVIVLTMISGARELMTPEAWEPKPGRLTYQVKQKGAEDQRSLSTENDRIVKRVVALTRIGERLRTLANSNDGQFPSDKTSSDIDPALWAHPDAAGLQFEYVSGRSIDDGITPLVCEPNIYADERLIYTCDGRVLEMTGEEIQTLISASPTSDTTVVSSTAIHGNSAHGISPK